MRRFALTQLLSTLTAFLIAPSAWGYSPESWSPPSGPRDGMGQWQYRMAVACAKEFRTQFAAWSRLNVDDAQIIGEALCAEGRIFWPFVEARDAETFRHVAEVVPPTEARPMIFGIASGPARYNSEVLHALRHALYPSSAMLWRWSQNAGAFQEWLAWDEGGRYGGVIFAVIDGETPEQIDDQIAQAARAIAYVNAPEQQLGGYTLIIDNRVPGLDLKGRLAVQRWIDLSPRPCQARLGPHVN